jgi:polar amino acid transport system substrate-binding protein
VTAEPLRLICMDADAMPLFGKARDGVRLGYEPSLAELLAGVLGRSLAWVICPWAEFAGALDAGRGDAILCGQGITDERRQRMDFTRPYAIFDESVIVRAGEGIGSAADLAGKRVGAIAGSTNIALAETFVGAELVPFGGATDDVFGEMIDALRAGDVDGVVDDDVALLPLAGDDALEIAFTVATRNAWGLGVAKDRPGWRDELDRALATIIADGRLRAAWSRWMPELAFPLASPMNRSEEEGS